MPKKSTKKAAKKTVKKSVKKVAKKTVKKAAKKTAKKTTAKKTCNHKDTVCVECCSHQIEIRCPNPDCGQINMAKPGENCPTCRKPLGQVVRHAHDEDSVCVACCTFEVEILCLNCTQTNSAKPGEKCPTCQTPFPGIVPRIPLHKQVTIVIVTSTEEAGQREQPPA
jgi:hypothetical protein